ncbi:hypothetical protein BC628DRAFT_163677 [Trametes gibbosa]|nr:hypothetical protein BC628DRAFT_163677 [Trametes gibbosa]
MVGRTLQEIPALHCVFTPQGVGVQLLCIDLFKWPQLFPTIVRAGRTGLLGYTGCKECQRWGSVRHLGLLQCVDGSGSLIALPLCPPRSHQHAHQEHSTFVVASHRTCGAYFHDPYHSVRLSHELVTNMAPNLSPKSVFITSRSPPHNFRLPHSLVSQTAWRNFGRPAALCILPWCEDTLRLIGLHVSPLQSRFIPLANREGLLHFTFDHHPLPPV